MQPFWLAFELSLVEREKKWQKVQVHTFVFLIRFPMDYRRQKCMRKGSIQCSTIVVKHWGFGVKNSGPELKSITG